MNPADTKSLKTDIDEEKAKILAKYFLSVFTTETNGNVPNLILLWGFPWLFVPDLFHICFSVYSHES
jgi:hypothetical protein